MVKKVNQRYLSISSKKRGLLCATAVFCLLFLRFFFTKITLPLLNDDLGSRLFCSVAGKENSKNTYENSTLEKVHETIILVELQHFPSIRAQ